MTDDNRTMADLAREAMQVQDACNLSGVVHSFAKTLDRLRRLLDESSEGFSQSRFHGHPIVTLWVSKISDLTVGTGTDYATFGTAYDAVKALAEGRP